MGLFDVVEKMAKTAIRTGETGANVAADATGLGIAKKIYDDDGNMLMTQDAAKKLKEALEELGDAVDDL